MGKLKKRARRRVIAATVEPANQAMEFPDTFFLSSRAAIALVIIAGVIAGYSLLSSRPYYCHDMEHHLPRLKDYYETMKAGQFPVRWLPHLMAGYGLPTFNYIPPLAYMAGAFLQWVGLGPLYAFKLLLFLSLPLSGVAMFLLAREIMRPQAAVVAAIAYMFAPYRFVDALVRGALPEALSFVFLPLVFLCVRRIWEDPRPIGVAPLALSLSGLLLSHNITALGGFGFALLYGLLHFAMRKSIRAFTLFISGFSLALAVSAFYWVPAVFETSLVHMEAAAQVGVVGNNFVYPIQLISNLWGYGYSLPGLEADGMSFQVGNCLMAGSILAAVWFWPRRRNVSGKEILFFLAVFSISILMTMQISQVFWNAVPLMKFFQYPWRFLAFATFGGALCIGGVLGGLWDLQPVGRLRFWVALVAIAFILDMTSWAIHDKHSPPIFANYSMLRLLSGAVLSSVLTVALFLKSFSSRTLTICMVLLLVVGSAPLWSLHLQRAVTGWPRICGVSSYDPEVMRRSFVIGDNHLAMVPAACKQTPTEPPEQRVEISNGADSVIHNLRDSGHWLAFDVSGAEQARFSVNIFFFPGWRATVDGEGVTPEVDSEGRMILEAPAGSHHVELWFGATPLRRMAGCVSVVGLAIMLVIFAQGRLSTYLRESTAPSTVRPNLNTNIAGP